MSTSVFDNEFRNIADSSVLSLADLRGKVLLIVNTASKCGFTKQYSALQNLHEKYKERGLVLIGVPSNDFLWQEPGSNEEILSFCQKNYHITFTMTEKEKVRGKNAHSFYQWIKKTYNKTPKWNFYKILINRDGTKIDFFLPTVAPESEELNSKIEDFLEEKYE